MQQCKHKKSPKRAKTYASVVLPSNLPDWALLSLREVLHLYPVSESTWWAGIATGRFPKPVSISPGRRAWRLSKIRALCEQAAATSEEEAA